MIPFLPLGCANGLNPELEPSIDEVNPQSSFYNDAMPLVPKYNTAIYEAGTMERVYRSAAIDYYEQVSPIGLTIATMDLPLDVPEPVMNVHFTAFSFSPGDVLPQEVYALTSGYLHYLPSEKSHPDLIGGAVADETMLILKPLIGTKDKKWNTSHPGTKPVLEQCVYRNVNLLSDEKLLELVALTTPDAYSKLQYKEKFGSDIENVDNWPEEYLTLFKENPEIPLIVKGGEKIATTKENSTTDLTQRLTLFFKMGAIGETSEKWTDHDDDVKTFFKYFQRRDLAGHPMIASLLNLSVKSGTIDLIPLNHSTNWSRDKANLITDFINEVDIAPPIIGGFSYHPLALDLDQDPPQLVVPREVSKPVWLKISNPLGLQITIIERIPTELTISPTTFSGHDQVVDIVIPQNLPPEDVEHIAQPEFDLITEDGALVQTVILTLLDPQPIPVRFFNLLDNNLQTATNMDETKLVEVIAYANRILGQQANVFINPVVIENKTLHDLQFNGNLGNPIKESWPGFSGAEDIHDQLAAVSQTENLNVVFVWDSNVKNDVGITYRGPKDVGLLHKRDYFMVMIDTESDGTYDASAKDTAEVLVHEIGHWFSSTFIFLPIESILFDEDACTGSLQHFNHDDCPDGHWSLYNNLMAPYKGEDKLFITIDQAKVYNTYAPEVIPNTENPNL